jgi:hypothetical protein
VPQSHIEHLLAAYEEARALEALLTPGTPEAEEVTANRRKLASMLIETLSEPVVLPSSDRSE